MRFPDEFRRAPGSEFPGEGARRYAVRQGCPGWAGVVVPLVCFGGLVGSALLFFTDARQQRQNMLPLLLLIAASFLCAFFGLVSGRIAPAWPLGLMGAAALAELAGCAALLGPEFLREIKQRIDPNV